jgi:hypothetical protein
MERRELAAEGEQGMPTDIEVCFTGDRSSQESEMLGAGTG